MYEIGTSIKSISTGKFGVIFKIINKWSCEVIFDGEKIPVVCAKNILILGAMRGNG